MGLAWCLLVLKMKVRINNPPQFWVKESICVDGIKISPLAIKKRYQNGSRLVSVGPREKVRINNPPQFWVKESICVDGIKVSPSTIMKKHKNGSNLVSVGPREKGRINDPPQFWVKESICVNGNQNNTFGHQEKAPKWV